MPVGEAAAAEVTPLLETPENSTYSRVISDIRHLVFIFGEPPLTPGNAADYFNRRELLRTHRYENPIIVNRFEDSAVIDFTSSSQLEDYAHKLLVPERPKYPVEYQRHIIHNGVPRAESSSLHLSGFAELEQYDTMSSLQYCLGALTVHAAHGWGRSV